MAKVYILDTNVLLADPGVLLSYPDAEVVVPETVLAELDKLKTSRVDPDLRFRGREISRILFDLSESGSLSAGVELPDGGSLRVATYDETVEMPDGLSSRNSDDRILAVSLKTLKEADGDAALITNDLNMLLKAQTLGIPVQRHGDGTEGGFARRYIVRPFQRYKVPIAILALAVAVFAAVLVLTIWGPGAQRSSNPVLPNEFKALLSPAQQNAFDFLTTLQSNPRDSEALLGMANFYYDARNTAQQAGDPTSALNFAQNGVRYYQRYLTVMPNDLNAAADYSAMLFYSGQSDQAIQEVGKVLAKDPNNIAGNFNLGIFYWQGNRRDYPGAAAQFQKVIALTKNNQQEHGSYQTSVFDLAQVKKQAAAAGTPIDTTQTIPSGANK